MKLKLFFFFALITFIIACSEEENPIPEPTPDCANTDLEVVVVDVNDTPCGTTDGSITLSQDGGSGNAQYSIDGSNFQSSPLFENIPPGLYRVKIKDEMDCEAEDQVLVSSGISLEEDVMPILTQSCALDGCHRPAQQSPNFTIKSGIMAAASNIKRHMEDNTMPPEDSGMERIPDVERATLICWVNDGAPDN